MLFKREVNIFSLRKRNNRSCNIFLVNSDPCRSLTVIKVFNERLYLFGFAACFFYGDNISYFKHH